MAQVRHTKRKEKDDGNRLAQERSQKIQYFEAFINEKLKTDLELVLQKRDKIYQSISEYLKLKNNLELIRDEKQDKLKTLVNLGADCFVKAKVPDTSFVYVHIGLGFHAQFTLDEAIAFIDVREKYLTQQGENLSLQAAEIGARIKLMYEGIAQLLGVDQL